MPDRQPEAGAGAGAITRASTLDLLTSALFGRPLVTNIHRGLLVEAMLAQALSDGWAWVGADWGAHDFRAASGLRLEVKQSAALQSWIGAVPRPSRAVFDIALRKAVWVEGQGWSDQVTRAEIYVLAHHPVTDPALADHRAPEQWRFHAVASANLPDQRRIGLAALTRRAPPVTIDAIGEAVDRLAASLEGT